MRQSVIYKGYEVRQNILSRKWYADPVNAMTSEDRLTAVNPAGLRALIDEATADLRPNPWELPRTATQQIPAAA